MWRRRTFHECTVELRGMSERFRAVYANEFGWNQRRVDAYLSKVSQEALELLRMLALAIRNEQDYGLATDPALNMGSLKPDAEPNEGLTLLEYCRCMRRPPSTDLQGFGTLGLREALNKVAHADPNQSGFYADSYYHYLILSGTWRSREWVAIFSVPSLCDAIEALPDESLENTDDLTREDA